jgi:hypothetical protein
MRGISGLKEAFATDLLWKISDKFLGQWADGSDVLYPTTTITTVNAAAVGSTTLAFGSALPASVVQGMAIDDDAPGSTSTAIRNRTTVNSIAANRLSLQITSPVPGGLKTALVAGCPIVFSDSNHPNLWKRWRHYLKVDMLPETHSAIAAAISEALWDTSFKYIDFQAVESDSQKALHATEFDLLPSGQLNFANGKKKQVVLLTARTTAPDPIDKQD